MLFFFFDRYCAFKREQNYLEIVSVFCKYRVVLISCILVKILKYWLTWRNKKKKKKNLGRCTGRRYDRNIGKQYWNRPLTLSQTSPVFSCLQYQSFENAMREGKIARNEQFLHFQLCFLAVLRTFGYFYQIWNCRLHTLSVWKSKKIVAWERVYRGRLKTSLISSINYTNTCKYRLYCTHHVDRYFDVSKVSG